MLADADGANAASLGVGVGVGVGVGWGALTVTGPRAVDGATTARALCAARAAGAAGVEQTWPKLTDGGGAPKLEE